MWNIVRLMVDVSVKITGDILKFRGSALIQKAFEPTPGVYTFSGSQWQKDDCWDPVDFRHNVFLRPKNYLNIRVNLHITDTFLLILSAFPSGSATPCHKIVVCSWIEFPSVSFRDPIFVVTTNWLVVVSCSITILKDFVIENPLISNICLHDWKWLWTSKFWYLPLQLRWYSFNNLSKFHSNLTEIGLKRYVSSINSSIVNFIEKTIAVLSKIRWPIDKTRT